ncbi:polyprenyl synthetase family protein [Candidatus Parcubacteria bacterium]|nr:polyprenyl synthetase family protein [Candidatus Parcubacteria bacterium]
MVSENNFNKILKNTTKKIDPIVKKILSLDTSKRTKKITNYQILTGGKRIRPFLTILCYKLVGGNTKDVLYPAAGLEILHNYTLIIDDLIDKSETRRERPSVWSKFGSATANCIAVNYASSIFQASAKSKYSIQISKIFAQTMKTLTEGEILDTLLERGDRKQEPYIIENMYSEIQKKDYFEMAGKKTASLFQTCCEVGGICANAKPKALNALKNFGFNLGIAFQIKDDILDIFGEEPDKKIGNDIKERKGGNIVIIFALQKLSKNDKQKLLKIMKKKKILSKDIKDAMKLIEKTNAEEKAEQLGKKYIDNAKKSLKTLPQNIHNEILAFTADFIMARKE